MAADVYACDDCGMEVGRGCVTCPTCNGRIIKVSPWLVATFRAIEAATGVVKLETGDVYRIVFETVNQSDLWIFSNANPITHKNTRQVIPNSEIPTKYWHEVITPETDDPWDQYDQLRQWSREDTEFVRNVRLQKQVSVPVWKDVKENGAEESSTPREKL